jgi:hypothetical protein
VARGAQSGAGGRYGRQRAHAPAALADVLRGPYDDGNRPGSPRRRPRLLLRRLRPRHAGRLGRRTGRQVRRARHLHGGRHRGRARGEGERDRGPRGAAHRRPRLGHRRVPRRRLRDPLRRVRAGRPHQHPHRGHGPAHGLHEGTGRPAAPGGRRAGGGQAAGRLHRR